MRDIASTIAIETPTKESSMKTMRRSVKWEPSWFHEHHRRTEFWAVKPRTNDFSQERKLKCHQGS